MTTTTDTASAHTFIRCCGMDFERPRWVAVLITVLLVGLCIGLGIWQIQRLHWKEGLIADLQAAQAGQPVTNNDLPPDLAVLAQKNFYPVVISGLFMHEQELHMVGRSRGGEPGFDVYTPLRLENDGRIVLVHRGWVPQNQKDPQQRQGDARSQKTVQIRGFISVSQGGSCFLPDHDVKGNVWFWPDIARINREKNLNLPPFVIEQVEQQPTPGALPVARRGYEVELRNDHWHYALMWFAMAASGLVIFVLSHRKPQREKPL